MKRYLMTALLGLAFLATPAVAQVEVGTDFGFSIASPDGGDNVTAISVPTGVLRVGFHTSDALAIEPRVAFNRLSSDGDSFSTLSLAAAILYSFTDRFYLFGEGGFSRISADDDDDGGDSATQGSFGGGIGLRKAIDNRLGLRWEAGVDFAPETDDFASSTTFSVTMGISFFSERR